MVTIGQQRLIVGNIKRVFRERNIEVLNATAYHFITLHMGHIAHFSLHGYRGDYRDLRLFCRKLRSSEYRDDPEYNRRWAVECDRRAAQASGQVAVREEEAKSYIGVGDTIRAILTQVSIWQATIEREFGLRQRDAELEQARGLAAKYGYVLTGAPE